jgi:hypothetical protein
MTRMTARWTTVVVAATALALPASGVAQTAPPAQPPATAQPPTQPEQAPARPANEPTAANESNAGQEAAKQHLTAARNALSQLTQLPAAGQLQGDARAHVTQLINNFNELITTKADWRAPYAKVQGNLAALMGPASADEPARASGVAGAVGTSGAASTLDPAIRAKLMEFRNHLDQFEKETAAGTTAATPATAPPATNTPPPPTTAQPPPPPPTDPPAAQPPPSDRPATVDPQEAMRHLEAIEVILSAHAGAQAAAQAAAGGVVGTTGTPSGSTRTTVTGKDVTLNQAQLEQLRTHLAELRRFIEKKK